MSDLTLPTGSVYGSRVSTSGDVTVGNVKSSNSYRVMEKNNEEVVTTDSLFVFEDSEEATEATRISFHTDSEVLKGGVSISVRNGETVDNTLQIEPTYTKIIAASNTATIDQTGLSFDQDDSSICFGANKMFRIKYDASTPQRLLFQYLDSSGQYVTKFSCLKGS